VNPVTLNLALGAVGGSLAGVGMALDLGNPRIAAVCLCLVAAAAFVLCCEETE
jgi:hypothetical protein